jgi:hypothetical protein
MKTLSQSKRKIRFAFWFISPVSIILSCLTVALICAVPSHDLIVFQHVNVIPMDYERVLEDQTVVVQDGKILTIGDHVKSKIPSSASVVNCEGRYMIPGLFDMHAHFFYEQGDNVNTCEAELKMMLANGLTTVRIECGDPVYLEARENVRSKKWIGPDLYVASPQFVGAWPWPGKVFAKIVRTPDSAAIAVKDCKEKGYDEIKITFMVKRDVYDAIINTAKQQSIKVTGHVGPFVKLPAALDARQQIEHMDEFIDMLLPDTSYNHGQSVSDMNIWRKKAWETVPYLDEKKLPELIESVRQADIYVTPTNYFFVSSFADSLSETHYRSRVDYAYIPPKIKEERWKVRAHYWKYPPPYRSREKYKSIRKKMIVGLSGAGVKLMAGSDSPEWFNVQGFSLHDELQNMYEAGMNPYAVLETATKNPATYLGIFNLTGSLTAGKHADFLLLEKNPLENVVNTRLIWGVMKDGKWYNKVKLDQLLTDARNALSQ